MRTDQQRAVFGGHTYAAREFLNVLEAGPYEGEDFHRIKVTGSRDSRWVNISPDRLRRIAAILDED